MSELRQDRTTGRWVIIAPRRGTRPGGKLETQRRAHDVAHDRASCPFCPGHEAELPGIVAETPAAGAPGWSVRVVPNKFPALQPQATLEAPSSDDHRTRAGRGIHEVVIESPRHDADLASMTAPERLAVVSMYRQRSRELLAQDGIETVVLFRNRGSRAGASQDHPHAQIVALDLVPPRLTALIETGLRHFQREGRCATCAELDVDRHDGRRVVEDSAHFVALVAFAAEHPFELWIVPKRHRASFTDIDDGELGDLGEILGRSLRRLSAALNDPSYRLVVDSAPKSGIAAPHLHWRLRIVPETVAWGGFELGAEMAINPSRPEDDAAALRAARAGDDEKA
jgi:UDPglucose--hexose-1-phosphate uridylyltransferase